LINNRQQGGRRRGRGGQRGPNVGGQPGNRQDNRQRGNAAQLHEKYKNMARDAQLAGDRVQTETYLQYADHYFRVLGESRSRFEDQRPQRGEDLDEDEGDDEMEAAEAQASDDREERQERGDRPRGRDRDRGDRGPRRYARDDRNADDGDAQPEPQAVMNGGDSLPIDVLPPAIGADSAVTLTPEEDEPVRPRRRSRATRPTKDEDDVAPAA
jgi:hypothetical protein